MKIQSIIKESIFLISLVLILGCFYSTYIYRTIAPNVEGWFEVYASEVASGKIPYKDFYLFTTPAFVYYLALVIKIFGNELYIIHLAGAFYHVLCGVFIFLVLKKIIKNQFYCLIASSVAVVISSIDTGEPFTYYNHFALFWEIFSLYLLTTRTRTNSLIAGFALTICFLSKQTIGFAWSISLIVGLLFISRTNKDYQYKLKYLVIGLLISVFIYIIYLVYTDSIIQFYDAIFLKGGSSKGSLLNILLRPIYPALLESSFLYPFIIAVLLNLVVFLGYYKDIKKLNLKSLQLDTHIVFNSLIFLLLSILFIFAIKYYYKFGLQFRVISRTLMYSGIIYAAGITTKSIYYNIKGIVLDEYYFYLTLLSISSLSIWYSLGLSFPIYEPVAVCSVPLFYILIFNNFLKKDNNVPDNLIKSNLFLILFSVLLIWLSLLVKFLHPWGWSFWNEPPVFSSIQRSSLSNPMLRHFSLSSSTNETINNVVDAINNYSLSDSDVFIYPYFPLFYYMCDKHPYTYSYVQFIDVCPDYVLQRDLETLRKNPPRVLVTVDCPRDIVVSMNNAFRSKGQSIQLQFYDYLETLKNKYNLVSKNFYSNDIYLSVYVIK